MISRAAALASGFVVERPMSEEQASERLAMTADIVAAYVASNAVSTGEVSGLIGSIHAALASLDAPALAEAPAAKPSGAVTIRKSLASPDHIISMIDGKPYAMLTRHIKQAGYTAQSYRQAFGLPADYPVVAPAYSEKRRALAKAIGLGRKKGEPAPKRRQLKIKTS
jgi:predicted transcriptional regulator